jgi:hypothetical protein
MTKPTLIYVSSTAKGKADGTAARPYATLEAARDALRKSRKKNGLKAPVRVLVAPGEYRLSAPLVFKPEDGGTDRFPITWAGDGGRPLLSGARAIAGWKEGVINGRPCWQAQLPEVAAGTWWFTQLFVNGRRRLRARLPKRGFFHFAGVPEAEAKADKGELFHGAMSALFSPGEVRAFRNLDDIDVVVPDHWYESHLRIASVNEAEHTIHFATKGYSRFSRDETGRGTRFRLDHVSEACTDPGDWYLDRASGVLSYIPMPGESREATRVEAPSLDLLLSVQGEALDPAKRVKNLRFEFLDFRYADWELPRGNPGCLQSDFNVPGAVRFVGAEDCALYGCRVSQVAGWAVEVMRGCRRNRIVACALHDLGAGGVKIAHEGGLPRGWVDGAHGAFKGMDVVALGWGPCREDEGGQRAGRDRSVSSATTVSDCSIHDGGLIFHSAIGIWIGDASGNRLVHNHIWNFSYSGISCGWEWGYAPAFTRDNRIEGNRIHGIGHGVLSDMGAVYTLGRQAGSTIRRNYISDVSSYGYGGWGIYPDEGSSWMHIEENVVCGTKTGGFHQHYGRDNIVRRNVFADAVENQVAISRGEIIRPVIFENNVVQGAGNGSLIHGLGCPNSRIDRNVYAGDPGAPALFSGKKWEQWQAMGKDVHGRMLEAVLLDAVGAAPATAQPAAFKAAGVDPRMVAAVVAEAGPRLRDVLPPTLDGVPAEPETRRPIVEPLFWPWEVEWPVSGLTKRPWSKLPLATALASGEPQRVSLTLENRGDAPSRGRYRLRVVPASAARIVGPAELAANLKPDGRAALDTTVVATGKNGNFSIEAVAEGDGLVDTCLFFSVSRILDVPRLPAVPELQDLAATLGKLTAQPVDGNGRPVKADVRMALAGDRLLVRIDTEDEAPAQGPNLWDGSSVELFVAPKLGAPRLQLVVAPAVDSAPAAARLIPVKDPVPADGVELDSARTKAGWMLAASIPLALLKLDPATDTLALDLVVNAHGKGGEKLCRTHLAGEQNPYNDSSSYLLLKAGI